MLNGIDYVLKKIEGNLKEFEIKFPTEQSTSYIYQKMDCVSWTEGFWTGMLWLAYELTGDVKYSEVAEKQLAIYKHRLDNQIALDTHDIGFLFSLSCVAQYKVTGDETAKQIAIRAADLLIKRYKPKGKFIQAWGDLNDDTNNRLIIDCLLNLPLLYWATEVTYDEKYKNIAQNHLKTALDVIIRCDFTTHHTYFFDPKSGEPLRGETHQGYSNESCWARGQAWGIYGIALSHAYTKAEWLIPLYKGVTDCFISRLPEDNIPYWDMIFKEGEEPRDTSAAAIAICGILEMDKYINEPYYMEYANKMLNSLNKNYTTKNIPNSNGILTDALYSKLRGDKAECNIWGDYFFTEALLRVKDKNWKMYW